MNEMQRYTLMLMIMMVEVTSEMRLQYSVVRANKLKASLKNQWGRTKSDMWANIDLMSSPSLITDLHQIH